MKLRGRASRYLLFVFGFLFLASSSVFAQYGQYGQYGGLVPAKTILIEKMVGTPTQTKGVTDQLDYVDNLSPSDPRFAPGQQIVFRLKVKNTSEMTLTDVQVRDFIPEFLTPVSGPGSFDAASRTVTFDAGDFAVGEEKVYFLTNKISAQDQMPVDKGIICKINKVEASTSNVFDEDSAQFCIEKQVQGVADVPAAGPELGLILMGLELGLLGIGITLKKRAK
jgi:uncharacterized repeat protein (TIGR01451 family)